MDKKRSERRKKHKTAKKSSNLRGNEREGERGEEDLPPEGKKRLQQAAVAVVSK